MLRLFDEKYTRQPLSGRGWQGERTTLLRHARRCQFAAALARGVAVERDLVGAVHEPGEDTVGERRSADNSCTCSRGNWLEVSVELALQR
jgi:hypothetical protein